ncbi:hypothetical protein CO081_03230 [Candidatus Pacearchaeota archaeon CG_4_9_14_0_8_um_filter_35_24]|nr:MAG: hypothetical protein CO081_03230 [Candidatus Pacearchaeota archaeon CG_4_9_14_0_8_um_filter_35_24]
MSKEIKIKKRTLFISLAVIVLVGLIVFSYSRTSVYTTNQDADVKELEAKFAVLSKANTNSCGGTFNYVASKSPDQRIQGSCCGPMNFHRYTEQIEALKKYSKYEKIPSDPYDVSVESAQELLSYQKEIVLSNEQQVIYDEASGLSHEGGPCCCKCWHWYAYEGLAKYLIVEENFTSEQIAEVWDISDACGGSGHVEGRGHGHT